MIELKREPSDDPRENLRRLMAGEETGVEEPDGGIMAWTDEQVCSCGSLMHADGVCERIEAERDRYRAALELIVATGSNDNHILEIARAALKDDK